MSFPDRQHGAGRRPEFTTFAARTEEVRSAIAAGADRLILDDPRVSIRSFAGGVGANLVELAEEARGLKPEIGLTVNIDLLAHHRHFPAIEQCFEMLWRAGLRRVRLQDPGLIAWSRERQPDIEIEWASENGNLNLESMRVYAGLPGVVRQTLSHECSHEVIDAAVLAVDGEFEVQVHGLILLQYSDRRLLSACKSWRSGGGLSPETAPAIEAWARDHRGKQYRFYDNPHGHFMYLHSDKCLIRHIPRLSALGLSSWLFDLRGEAPEALAAALRVYREAHDLFISDAFGEAEVRRLNDELRSVSRRPLRAAFFLRNATDLHADEDSTSEDPTYLGEVRDIVRGACFTVELARPLTRRGTYRLATPQDRHIELTDPRWTDLDGHEPESATVGQFVQFPWIKGVVPHSRLLSSDAVAE